MKEANSEPRYSAKERRARRAEVKRLRDEAVRSWNADDGSGDPEKTCAAIVMMTYRDYLALVARAEEAEEAEPRRLVSPPARIGQRA
jgi:hypothetical protein